MIDLQTKIDFYLNTFKEKPFYHPNSFLYSRAYTEDKNRKKRGHKENQRFFFCVEVDFPQRKAKKNPSDHYF